MSYSVLLNDNPYDLIKPSRGLRQGDLLSPFLFMIGTDVLSKFIVRVESLGLVHGIKISRTCGSSHIPLPICWWYNDLYLSLCSRSHCCCQYHQHIQGLVWSDYWHEESISFSKNLQQAGIDLLTNLIGINHATQPGKYLGLPLILPRSKRHAFLEVKDKLLRKILCWKLKLLSQAGRACELA